MTLANNDGVVVLICFRLPSNATVVFPVVIKSVTNTVDVEPIAGRTPPRRAV